MPPALDVQEIGPYRIIDLLGEGGMGRVYRAEQRALGREVALKVLPGHVAERPGFRERFLREVKSMARVNHPNVVTCYDAGEHDGRLWMALELVQGGDAAGLIQPGNPLSVARALAVIADAACGLQAIADAGLVHRDIKPGNIFLTTSGQAKLADLGLARQVDGGDRLTMPGLPLGTPAYMAPEQAAGDEVDIRADIYALGAALYALLCGEPPFTGEHPLAVLRLVMEQPAPDPRVRRADLPEAVAVLILRCLAKQPEQRPASPRLLERALRDLLAGGGAARPAASRSARVPVATSDAQPTVVANLAQASEVLPATTSAVRREPATTPPASTSPPPPSPSPVQRDPAMTAAQIDRAQLAKLVRRIHFTDDRLTAWINLAPGATFPVVLLELLLREAGVVHGVSRGAVASASAPSDLPRRLILASGDPPYPGTDGRGVDGRVLSGQALELVLQVDDEAMEAWAYLRPGAQVGRAAVERQVKGLGLRFGLLKEAVKRLWEGPPVLSGRLCLARGKSAVPTRQPSFQVRAAELPGEPAGPRKVGLGTEVAVWEEAEPGVKGMDLFGRIIAVEPAREADPRQLAGEGVELARDRAGLLILKATRAGVVHRRPDGTVRVVPALEIAGDLGPDHPPVHSDDLVVVRGSVLPGARVSAAGDVVVLGDLHDAVIEAGGCVEVAGDICAGSEAVRSGGEVVVGGHVRRQVIAGALRIAGALEHCQVAATGGVEVHRVVGGAVVAGGDIRADHAGDALGTTTELWAGHQPGLEAQDQVAALAERAVAAERKRLLTEMELGRQELDLAKKQQLRLASADWTAQTALTALAAQVARLDERRQAIDRRTQEAQSRLAEQRSRRCAAADAMDDGKARLLVRQATWRGVVLRLAGADPIVQQEDGGAISLGLG